MWSALAARRLISSNLENGGEDIEVTVIAPEAKLVLRPRLYEANPASMSAVLGDLFQVTGVRFIQGTVESIHVDKHEIAFSDPTGARSSHIYDRLILAAGSRLKRPNIAGIQEYTFDVDQIEGASKLDTHLDSLASVTPSKARDTVVICGGGFTGIELAAELPHRLRKVLGDNTDIRVVIVEREGEIGPDLGPNPRPVIIQALKDLGVEMKLGAAVVKVDAGGITLSTGERIDTLTAVWTGGMVANELNNQVPGEKDRAGRLHVDGYLRTLSVKDIFATGDAAFAATDDKGNHSLMSCQHAVPLGTAAGYNAAADLLGIAMMPYSQPQYVTCLDLGPFGAVVSEGWERNVLFKGAEAKPIKQFVNGTLIYPPGANSAEAFQRADPVLSSVPIDKSLYLALIENARTGNVAVA
jgi:NADH dehydrogenase